MTKKVDPFPYDVEPPAPLTNTDKATDHAWRKNWAAVGVAKAELASKFQALINAERAMVACGVLGISDGVPVCRCEDNRHGKAYAKADTDRDKTVAEVDKAIAKFKGGVKAKDLTDAAKELGVSL